MKNKNPNRPKGRGIFNVINTLDKTTNSSYPATASGGVFTTNKKLVLFDIDHTIMDVGDSHKKVFASAFNKVLGLDLDYKTWTYHGYTDLQIIEDIFDKNNIEKDKTKISKIIDIMIVDFEKEDLVHAFLHDGVKEIIDELNKNEEVVLGLVTGNVEQIAYTKLKHFKMAETFLLGGFGNSSSIRKELVDIAIKNAENDFGRFDKNDVFIIGDTIHDVTAAKESGVKCIAVATGTYSKEKLKEMEPDYVFADLKDTKKIIEIITK